MAVLTLSPRGAVDGLGNQIPNGVNFNDYSGTGAGPFGQTPTLIDSAQNEILGVTTGSAITSDANGAIHDYIRGLVKLMAAGLPPVGETIPSGSMPVTVMQPVTGSYRMASITGTMAAGLGGGASIWQLRYGGTGIALVRRIVISIGGTATAFAAGACTFNLFVARSFTVNGSGGIAATLTGNNGKLRTSYATNNLSDLRISNNAALTAGTWTLDSTPIASRSSSVGTTAGTVVLPAIQLLQRDSPDDVPVQLAQNEGLNIQATVPGTGTWTASVEVDWDEVASYS